MRASQAGILCLTHARTLLNEREREREKRREVKSPARAREKKKRNKSQKVAAAPMVALDREGERGGRGAATFISRSHLRSSSMALKRVCYPPPPLLLLLHPL